MIKVTRLDGSHFTINSDLIEFIEATPDTVLTLITHKKLIVRESADEVVRRVVAYKRRIHHYPPTIVGQESEGHLCLTDPVDCCPQISAEVATEKR